MMVKKWACGHCKTLADSEQEAMQCCPPTDVWECSECGDYVEDKTEHCEACEVLVIKDYVKNHPNADICKGCKYKDGDGVKK